MEAFGDVTFEDSLQLLQIPLQHGSHRTWKTWKNHGKKITLENSWKYHGKMTSLWKNEILSPELPKLVNFSKKIACGGLKLMGFWSQFSKIFACGGQSTYLLILVLTYLYQQKYVNNAVQSVISSLQLLIVCTVDLSHKTDH